MTIGVVEGISIVGHVFGTFVASLLLSTPDIKHPEEHWKTFFYPALVNLAVLMLVFFYTAYFFSETNKTLRKERRC